MAWEASLEGLPSLVGQKTFSVAEITYEIRRWLEKNEALADVWVEGEMSNFTRHRSGHLYFTLKDNEAQLRAVMFKSQAMRLRFAPAHGDLVRAHGKISVYEARGEYQLYVDNLEALGQGDLYQQYEKLKKKLADDGLFDPSLRRPLPPFPRTIGIVSSPTGAALRDVLNILRRRYPIAHVVLSPSLVQGVTAAPAIMRALKRLNLRGDIDVILMVRGGGSLEDMWCFNDENLVRAVRASETPVVTGVGHEIDTTLVDYAADLRAPTPSAAAELATPDFETLAAHIAALQDRLDDSIHHQLDTSREQVNIARRHLRHLSPVLSIQNFHQRLDELDARLQRGVHSHLATLRQQWALQQAALDAANPTAILTRGYAIVTRVGDGKQIDNALDAAPGTLLHIQLHQGSLRASVKERTLNEIK